MDVKQSADEHYQKAISLSTKKWYSFIYDHTDSYKAVSHFVKAANLYKLERDVDSSVKSFEQAAMLEDNAFTSAQYYDNAAELLKNTDKVKTQELVNLAVKRYTTIGRFDYAAKSLQNLLNHQDPLELYLKMVDLYQLSNKIYEKFMCYQKIIDIYLDTENFIAVLPLLDEMITHYRQTRYETSSEQHIVSYMVIYFYLHHQHLDDVKNKLKLYYPTPTWIDNVIRLYEYKDDAYDSIVRKQCLKQWQTGLLLNIKLDTVDTAIEDEDFR